VVKSGIEEEALVLEFEVLVLLANSALTEREQLLTLGESADRYSPFLESDWHFKSVPGEVVIDIYGAGRKVRAVRGRSAHPRWDMLGKRAPNTK